MRKLGKDPAASPRRGDALALTLTAAVVVVVAVAVAPVIALK